MTKRLDKAAEVAKATMFGDLRDVLLDIMKHTNKKGTPWKDMKESEQREIAAIIQNQVANSINKSIAIIASEGRKHVKVQLKQVTIKDGLKGQFECSKTHELRHELIDAQGDYVLVVLIDSGKYMGEKAPVRFDADQPTIPGTITQVAPNKWEATEDSRNNANDDDDTEEEDFDEDDES